MLTDRQIKQLIKEGKIRISPFQESSIETSVYRVKLGEVLLIPVEGQVVDLKESHPNIEYERVAMSEAGYLLKPKEFILGQTMETIALDGDIAAFIDGRSTLARLGISLHQSSTIIQPGQDAHIITLEIFNAGPFTIKIYPGLVIGKLIFFQSTEKNEVNLRDYGKYVGQSETTGPRIG